MTHWNPIATAPKDGTPILVTGGTCWFMKALPPEPRQLTLPLAVFWRERYDIWFGGHGGDLGEAVAVDPQFWMALEDLPAPPTTQQESGE